MTRREAMRRGLLAGGTVLAASTADAAAKEGGDAAVLQEALRLEHTAAAAYDAAIRSGRLAPKVLAAAKLFKRHEQEHAAALAAALRKLGQSPSAGTDAKLVAKLAKAHDQAAILRFAIDLERMAVVVYHEAQEKLREPSLLKTAAQIMADEGQHLVVLRQALGGNPVPEAFETGKDSA